MSQQQLWDHANEMSLEEQIYQIARHTCHDEVWAMAQPTERRLMWVTRILGDLKFENERHNDLIRTMIKLWGGEG